MKKLSAIRKGKPRFQLMPPTTLRWDSPIFVDIPPTVWNAWMEYVEDQHKKLSYEEIAEQNLLRAIHESSQVGVISPQHLQALLQRWCENNEEEEVELDT